MSWLTLFSLDRQHLALQPQLRQQLPQLVWQRERHIEQHEQLEQQLLLEHGLLDEQKMYVIYEYLFLKLRLLVHFAPFLTWGWTVISYHGWCSISFYPTALYL